MRVLPHNEQAGEAQVLPVAADEQAGMRVLPKNAGEAQVLPVAASRRMNKQGCVFYPLNKLRMLRFYPSTTDDLTWFGK